MQRLQPQKSTALTWDAMSNEWLHTVSISVGLATTIAIILHEIPQELGDFGVLIHAGFSRGRALVFNVMSGLLAIIGAIVSLLASQYVMSFSEFMLPFTAGDFIYIAGSDVHQSSTASPCCCPYIILQV